MIGIDNRSAERTRAPGRKPAWHRLGTVVPPDADVPRALSSAGLGGWTVRVEANHRHDRAAASLPRQRSAFRATGLSAVRDHPRTGVHEVIAEQVPAGFAPLQNEAAFEWCSDLIDEGLSVDSAGALYGGREPWMLFAMPEPIVLADADPVKAYLAVLHSHDGSRGPVAMLTGVRLAGGGTQAMALSMPTPRFEVPVPGDGGSDPRSAASRALVSALRDLSLFTVAARTWMERPVRPGELDRILARVAPGAGVADPGRRTRRRLLRTVGTPMPQPDERTRRRLVDSVRRLLEAAPDGSGVRGSAWDVLQALWEAKEHHVAQDADRLADIALAGARRRRIAAVIATELGLDRASPRGRDRARRLARPLAAWRS